MNVAYALAAYRSYNQGPNLIPLIAVGAVVLIAWIMSIIKLIDVAEDKGCKNTGSLWFIGLFASPIVLGLYVASLPDNKLRSELSMLRKDLSK